MENIKKCTEKGVQTKKGFTLIELVVVIAVIAILSAVSVASYFGVVDSANQKAVIADLTTFRTIILSGLLDNDATTLSNASITSNGSGGYEISGLSVGDGGNIEPYLKSQGATVSGSFTLTDDSLKYTNNGKSATWTFSSNTIA